mgnify:CR=1 FL=1
MEELIQFVEKWLIDVEAAIIINNHQGKTETSAAKGNIYYKEQERVKHLLSSLIALGEVEHFEKQLSNSQQDVVTAVLIANLESQLKIEKVKAEVYYWSGTTDIGLHGATKEAIKEIEKQIAELKK